jgi:hypothetical protein
VKDFLDLFVLLLPILAPTFAGGIIFGLLIAKLIRYSTSRRRLSAAWPSTWQQCSICGERSARTVRL